MTHVSLTVFRVKKNDVIFTKFFFKQQITTKQVEINCKQTDYMPASALKFLNKL